MRSAGPGSRFPGGRRISPSFPSGHAASAFAFAYAVGRHLPGLAVPIRLLAAAVAYSRVHTGVHYPGDVVVGSVTGAGTAAMVAAVVDRLPSQR
jgi:membrane-associated phospholipid phosphatase